jgi:radical SAM-linked protein
MARDRVRIRFSKLGDLRLISHRDLARVWERMFRRADLQLAMSEGFRPKPRIHFPSALSLGVAGLEEVVEVELTPAMAEAMTDGAALQSRLSAQAPPGLTIAQLEVLPETVKQARAQLLSYELPIPPERRAELASRIDWLLGQTSVLVPREERKPLDLRPMLDRLQLVGDTLQMRLRIDLAGTVRPGEVLGALGAQDLEQQGMALTRTQVELFP